MSFGLFRLQEAGGGGRRFPGVCRAGLRMMISHEAVNKIESLKRGAFGILPVLCPAKCQGERVESWKRGLSAKAGLNLPASRQE